MDKTTAQNALNESTEIEVLNAPIKFEEVIAPLTILSGAFKFTNGIKSFVIRYLY